MQFAQVVTEQLVAALLRSPTGAGNQGAQVLVTTEVLYQQHKLRAIVQAHFTADDQAYLLRFGSLPGTHDAGQGALIGNRQGLVTLLPGSAQQLFGAGCAALEAEVGQAMQFGVARRAHANQPCSHKGPGWARSR
ncbi:hypothetical protein D3C79_727400 [compost metagenome]